MLSTSYCRLWTDDAGETHFDDVDVELDPMDFAPPAPELHYRSLSSAVSVGFLGGDPFWEGDIPHPTPCPQFLCTMTGAFEFTASDGEVRRFDPGDLVLLEDTDGKGHSTRIIETCIVLTVALA
jgi:hypothetical protein